MRIDISHIAKLARLNIREEEMEKFEKQMQAMVEMVEQAPQVTDRSLGVDENNPMTLREDMVRPSLRREEILKNAPKTQAGCILVPKTVE